MLLYNPTDVTTVAYPVIVTNDPSKEILKNLNSDQLQAVTSPQHPLIIIAGAGSGKTRVLTRRIAYRIATGDAEARHTLAITFTKKAADELKQRLSALEMRDRIEAHTFHAASLRILQRFWEANQVAPFKLLESKFKLVSDAISSIGATTKTTTQSRDSSRQVSESSSVIRKSLISSVIIEIEWAKAHGLNPHEYANLAVAQNRTTPLTPSEMSEIFRRYEQLKHKARLVDYDDLITQATWALNSDANFAATERYRVRHLYIDEFQDVNTNQMNLVNAILGERVDLCVVGDPNQAIYSWNGADPTLISSLSQRFPQSQTVVLSHNYRSTPQILAIAKTTLAATGTTPQKSYTDLVPHLPDGAIPTIRALGDEQSESETVARLVKKSHQPGFKWSDIAILARTNSQLIVFQNSLKALGIPAFLAGETNYLSNPEIRTLLSSLERSTSNLVGTSLYTWLEEVITQLFENYAESSSATDNLTFFLQLAKEFLSASPSSDSRALSIWLKSEAQNAKEESASDAVSLTTFHKAKGLEWKSVFIVGLEDGYVPISRAESKESLEEERRLLYVAITRAQKELTLTWAKSRKYNERYMRRDPSPYLSQIEDQILTLSGHIASPEHALHNIARARKTLEKKQPVELNRNQKSTLESLRLWRSEKSKELGVPAHLILHDHALESITLRNPQTIEALAKIAGIGNVRASRFGNDLLRCVKI